MQHMNYHNWFVIFSHLPSCVYKNGYFCGLKYASLSQIYSSTKSTWWSLLVPKIWLIQCGSFNNMPVLIFRKSGLKMLLRLWECWEIWLRYLIWMHINKIPKRHTLEQKGIIYMYIQIIKISSDMWPVCVMNQLKWTKEWENLTMAN